MPAFVVEPRGQMFHPLYVPRVSISLQWTSVSMWFATLPIASKFLRHACDYVDGDIIAQTTLGHSWWNICKKHRTIFTLPNTGNCMKQFIMVDQQEHKVPGNLPWSTRTTSFRNISRKRAFQDWLTRTERVADRFIVRVVNVIQQRVFFNAINNRFIGFIRFIGS